MSAGFSKFIWVILGLTFLGAPHAFGKETCIFVEQKHRIYINSIDVYVPGVKEPVKNLGYDEKNSMREELDKLDRDYCNVQWQQAKDMFLRVFCSENGDEYAKGFGDGEENCIKYASTVFNDKIVSVQSAVSAANAGLLAASRAGADSKLATADPRIQDERKFLISKLGALPVAEMDDQAVASAYKSLVPAASSAK